MTFAGRLVNDVLCALVRQVENSPPGAMVEGGAREVVRACDMIIAPRHVRGDAGLGVSHNLIGLLPTCTSSRR